MGSLLRSRKFWIMIANTVVSSVVYFVTKYAAPEIGNDVLWLIGSWQPAIIALITGIAIEDSAAINSVGVTEAAQIAAGK